VINNNSMFVANLLPQERWALLYVGQTVSLFARIILKWILERYAGRLHTRFIWLRIGTSTGKLWTP